MADYDDIENAIIKALEGVNEAGVRGEFKGDGQWTRRIKNALCSLANDRNYKPYASSCDQACGAEWLYDLVWLTMEDKHVRDVHLIAECEWDRKLMGDFQKLVIGRAAHRLMIFQARSKEEKDRQLAEFGDEIEGSAVSQPGDRYLFACWDRPDKRFRFKLYVR